MSDAALITQKGREDDRPIKGFFGEKQGAAAKKERNGGHGRRL